MAGFPEELLAQVQMSSGQLTNQQRPYQKKAQGQGYKRSDGTNWPCLYIGNLPEQNFFDLDLFKFFTSRGYKLKSAMIQTDKKTQKLFQFGFLNFHSDEECSRCLKEMNNTVIHGKAIILNRQGEKSFDNRANVFVRNLAKQTNQQTIFNTFKSFGTIQSCKLQTFSDGTSKGFAYVQFKEPEAAEKAIEALNGTSLDGKEINVMLHQKQKDRTVADTPKFTNIFVTGLEEGTNDEGLKSLFSKYGEIDSVHV